MTRAAPVHTPAPPSAPGAPAGPVVHLTGTLRQHGEARARQIDTQGNQVPVLCLELENVHVPELGITLERAHVEQRFPPTAYAACNAAARRHKRGDLITATHPKAELRLVALNVSHIHVHQPQEATPS